MIDTKTPRLDALARRSKNDNLPGLYTPISTLTELLLSIHWALDGLRGDRRASGPYGALEHIADAVETYLEDQETEGDEDDDSSTLTEQH